MATAFQTVKVVPDGVNLTLSQEEAEILMVVLGCVGGDPEKSHRKTTESILNTLRETQEDRVVRFSAYPNRGSIVFPTLDL